MTDLTVSSGAVSILYILYIPRTMTTVSVAFQIHNKKKKTSAPYPVTCIHYYLFSGHNM